MYIYNSSKVTLYIYIYIYKNKIKLGGGLWLGWLKRICRQVPLELKRKKKKKIR